MIFAKSLVLLLILATSLVATEEEIRLVPMPLRCPSKGISATDVPTVLSSTNPEATFEAIILEFKPAFQQGIETENLNVANVAKIQIQPHHASPSKYRVGIDFKDVEEKFFDVELLGALFWCIKSVGEKFKLETDIILLSVPLESELFDSLAELENEYINYKQLHKDEEVEEEPAVKDNANSQEEE